MVLLPRRRFLAVLAALPAVVAVRPKPKLPAEAVGFGYAPFGTSPFGGCSVYLPATMSGADGS
jgi:hypothetical protein